MVKYHNRINICIVCIGIHTPLKGGSYGRYLLFTAVDVVADQLFEIDVLAWQPTVGRAGRSLAVREFPHLADPKVSNNQ